MIGSIHRCIVSAGFCCVFLWSVEEGGVHCCGLGLNTMLAFLVVWESVWNHTSFGSCRATAKRLSISLFALELCMQLLASDSTCASIAAVWCFLAFIWSIMATTWTESSGFQCFFSLTYVPDKRRARLFRHLYLSLPLRFVIYHGVSVYDFVIHLCFASFICMSFPHVFTTAFGLRKYASLHAGLSFPVIWKEASFSFSLAHASDCFFSRCRLQDRREIS
jgi:hypothetical protein